MAIIEFEEVEIVESDNSLVGRFHSIEEEQPGILVVELAHLNTVPSTALLKLRLHYRDQRELLDVKVLEDLEVGPATFTRRAFLDSSQGSMTIFAMAALMPKGLDILLQFVVPGDGMEMDFVEEVCAVVASKAMAFHTTHGLAHEAS